MAAQKSDSNEKEPTRTYEFEFIRAKLLSYSVL